jgi:hypothetical protein
MSPWQFDEEQEPGPIYTGFEGTATVTDGRRTTLADIVKRCLVSFMVIVYSDSCTPLVHPWSIDR